MAEFWHPTGRDRRERAGLHSPGTVLPGALGVPGRAPRRSSARDSPRMFRSRWPPPAPRLRLLHDALGADAERVQLLDMTVAGRNPGRIIAEVLLATAAAHPDRHVRIIGEPIWPGRSEIEYPACVQHEALINLAFRGRRATILCPYDVAGLDSVRGYRCRGQPTRPSSNADGHGAARTMRRNASCPATTGRCPNRLTRPSCLSTPPRSPSLAGPRPNTPETPAWTRKGPMT